MNKYVFASEEGQKRVYHSKEEKHMPEEGNLTEVGATEGRSTWGERRRGQNEQFWRIGFINYCFLSEKYRKTTEGSNQGSDIISFAITKSNSDFGQENGLEGCRGWVWRDGGGAVLWRGVNGWKRCLEGGTDLLVINGLWWDKKMEVSKVIFRFGLGHLGEW